MWSQIYSLLYYQRYKKFQRRPYWLLDISKANEHQMNHFWCFRINATNVWWHLLFGSQYRYTSTLAELRPRQNEVEHSSCRLVRCSTQKSTEKKISRFSYFLIKRYTRRADAGCCSTSVTSGTTKIRIEGNFDLSGVLVGEMSNNNSEPATRCGR